MSTRSEDDPSSSANKTGNTPSPSPSSPQWTGSGGEWSMVSPGKPTITPLNQRTPDEYGKTVHGVKAGFAAEVTKGDK